MAGLLGLMGVEIQSDSLCVSQCPFCGSNKFIFNDEDFACYSCGIAGDTVDFVALKNGISKTAAKGLLFDNTEVFKVLDFATSYYQKSLHKKAYYFYKRGLNRDSVEKYRLGWADGGLHEALLKEGFKEDSIIKAGVCRSDGRDLFYKRVIFPIMNEENQVVGLGGRKIEESNAPKYLNSPESNVFSKRETLYGIQNIESNKPVYIVEGYMDALALQQAGINAVAVLGTAVGIGHVALLKSLKIKDVILSLDGDEAGIKNAVRAISILKPYFNVTVLNSYGSCKDPDEFVKTNGGEAFMKLPTASTQKFLLSKAGMNIVDVL